MSIVSYGVSLIGKSHVKKGVHRQDNYKVTTLDNGWVIAAVADGVGSAANSEIGSEIAVDVAVEFCKEFMPLDEDVFSIRSMLRTAFNYAFKKITQQAKKDGNPIESYDTTLTLVIYTGSIVIYAHSGDGGIIGLTTDGEYKSLTRQIKADDGICVIPLRAGYKCWDIGHIEGDYAAVILATDGMYELMCPRILRDRENDVDRVYIPFTSFFLDPTGIAASNINLVQQGVERFMWGSENYNINEYYNRLSVVFRSRTNKEIELIESVKASNKGPKLMMEETDDKTVVALFNTDAKVTSREADYYREPDWDYYNDQLNRVLYPHLYNNKSGNSDAANKSVKSNKIENTTPENKENTATKTPISSEVKPANTEGAKNDGGVGVEKLVDSNNTAIENKQTSVNTTPSNNSGITLDKPVQTKPVQTEVKNTTVPLSKGVELGNSEKPKKANIFDRVEDGINNVFSKKQ